jgi:hypothetical protein
MKTPPPAPVFLDIFRARVFVCFARRGRAYGTPVKAFVHRATLNGHLRRLDGADDLQNLLVRRQGDQIAPKFERIRGDFPGGSNFAKARLWKGGSFQAERLKLALMGPPPGRFNRIGTNSARWKAYSGFPL